ncbi:hypothetical protein [Pseudonocardia asaccharolytica]|uniref:Uncharacterized protein n=1 Tax=Pseudonocardia asaccharolytica DSM 44247 = NBRC 16224 TaxID=1123024 RepID=A0A511D436_9PSEU|nr:hypothetical protein [Pseudonocardia asaccharolytica]GEL19551.1 hypothetical protein PA7_33880 [Pseudonocardia asaccharolytica DSM 44247 = NBRC 16224]
MLVDLGVVPVGEITAALVVPAQNPSPPPGRGEEFGKASPIALVVIILLALATVLLIRSMSKRIRKLPASFGSERAGRRTSAEEPVRDETGGDAESGDDPGRT